MPGESLKVAGFGFRRGAQLASLEDALAQLETHHGVVDRLAAPHTMCSLVEELGRARGLAVINVTDTDLPSAMTLTRSPHSVRVRGTGSVAEASALLAAGPGARLLGPRLISADRQATAAVASGTLIGDCS